MRCYLMRNGRIGAVELVTDASDEAAIKQAETLFEQRKDRCYGFEVWDRARLVYRYPDRAPKHTQPGSGMTWNNPRASRAKNKTVEEVRQAARRVRREARAWPRGEIRANLEAAADKLDALVSRMIREDSTPKKPD